MKKILIASVCGLAMAGSAFAQGNVNWGSIPFNAMTAQTNATAYSPLFGGGATGGGTVGATATAATGFYYALLYTSGIAAPAPTSVASLGTWSSAGLSATNATASAGRLVPIAGNAGAQVPWSPGVTNSIMLVGWSANLGTTWAAAYAKLQDPNTIVGAGYFGMSTVGWITTLSTATTPGSTVFATAVTQQGTPINSVNTQLYLIPVAVPEPATMVLAGLGGLALLGLRRKK